MSSNSPTPQADDRRNAIIEATVDSFGKLGYYGTSLQRIATEVGLTKAGVLHYVGSKEGLLSLVLSEVYDGENLDIMTAMVAKSRPLIADMWRKVVAINAKRPALVHMFSTLSAEALDPEHPAHEYFVNRERQTVSSALNINWSVPDGVNVEHVLQAGLSMMDGIQLRWLRSPDQDLNAMWADCEEVLFPLPQWNGYR
ncbi:TetR/AcrR family transcriptional regulator [Bifidobacterium sp. LC6]|uniref:TetR/AcrR family transcriptional regulator n=1 Tax=Bifidobacterium colobi TaxID=2809026 RepID=A0ABS5UWQ6_9BIFI|nr:helix-turn-helix domain-containing protein [Bifidobacterium colobi]MBT1175024.1 TetR/AcrR family transcriptional regulator [Bifidobacterium colobi]